MREIEITGTLAAGEKALAELKKRKLVIQKYTTLDELWDHFAHRSDQEGTVLHREQGIELQHVDGQARDGPDGGHADLVCLLLKLHPFTYPASGAHGRRRNSRSTTLRQRVL
jgi:hypothetical protein